MNQLTTAILVVSGLILLAYIAGLPIDNALLDIMLSSESVSVSTLWITITASIATTALAITIGLYYKDIEKSVMTVLMPIVGIQLWNIIQLYQFMLSQGFLSMIFAVLVFSPILVYLPYLCVEYWRGKD